MKKIKKSKEEDKTSIKRTGDKISICGSYQYNAYYTGSRIQRFWHYIRLKESAIALNTIATDTVLDIGCGSGLFASFIASENAAAVLAIDANKEAIDFCRLTYQLNNLTFEQKTTDEINLREKSLDKIVLLEVIEHITKEQAELLLKNIQRLLKPGGLLVISTPNKRSLWPIIEFVMDKLKLAPKMNKEQHEVLYSRKQLSKLAANNGLMPITEKTILFLSPWAAILHWRLGLYFHKLEMKFKSKTGSILLHTFQK